VEFFMQEAFFMVAFFNSFLSYLMLMVVIAAVAGVAIFIGITMRKKKNQAESAAQSAGAGYAEEK